MLYIPLVCDIFSYRIPQIYIELLLLKHRKPRKTRTEWFVISFWNLLMKYVKPFFERSFLRAKRLIARYRACNSVFTVADNRRVIQYDEILRGSATSYPRRETIARAIVISSIFPELDDDCEGLLNVNLDVRFLVVSAIIFFSSSSFPAPMHTSIFLIHMYVRNCFYRTKWLAKVFFYDYVPYKTLWNFFSIVTSSEYRDDIGTVWHKDKWLIINRARKPRCLMESFEALLVWCILIFY